MTGHRKATGKPLGPVATNQRRAVRAETRLADVRTPMERVTVVMDYARAMVANVSPNVADDIAARVSRAVLTEIQRAVQEGVSA